MFSRTNTENLSLQTGSQKDIQVAVTTTTSAKIVNNEQLQIEWMDTVPERLEITLSSAISGLMQSTLTVVTLLSLTSF